MKSLPEFTARVLYFFIAVYLVSLVFSYEKTWMHPELPMVFHPSALKTGISPSLSDLGRVLEYEDFDSTPRSRLFSLLTLIWNEKLRLWLFEFIPPHPSLSITWVFTLFLSPLLFFLVARRLAGDTQVSALGTAIFSTSVGSLSGITLLFHPGKPLAIFFILLTLFLYLQVREELPKGQKRSLPFFFTTLLLGFFSEETFWFALIAIPILFPKPLFTEKRYALFRIGFFGSFLAFIALLQFGLSYPFLQYALTENFGLRLPQVLPFGSNAVNLSRDFFFPSNLGSFAWVVAVLLTATMGFLTLRLDHQKRALSLRLGLIVLAFAVYQTLLFTRGNILIRSGFYYGSAFAVFASLFITMLLSASRVKTLIKVISVAVICVVSISNFETTNRQWRAYHAPIYRGALPQKYSALREGEKVSREEILRIWRNSSALPSTLPLLPPDAYGLLSEIESLGR